MPDYRVRPEIYRGDTVRSAEGIPIGAVKELYIKKNRWPMTGAPDSFWMAVDRGRSVWYVPTHLIAASTPEAILLQGRMAELEAARVGEMPDFLARGEGLKVYIFNRRLEEEGGYVK